MEWREGGKEGGREGMLREAWREWRRSVGRFKVEEMLGKEE